MSRFVDLHPGGPNVLLADNVGEHRLSCFVGVYLMSFD
jgi:hypothetical protein